MTRSPSSPNNSSSFQVQEQKVQEQEEEDLITDEEARQLNHMVERMKAMALGVHKEQTHQFERIEALVDTVDNAKLRLQSANRRMKKLT
jgi:hypothetical protein